MTARWTMRSARRADRSEPPLSDTRLSVHTLVREDIFAGVLDNDMERLARGEKSIEVLLVERPAEQSLVAGAVVEPGEEGHGNAE